MKYFVCWIALAVCAAARPAVGQVWQLNTLLPDSVPGFGETLSLGQQRWGRGDVDMTGWQAGDLNIAPQLGVNIGYDSAPNGGAPGSATTVAAPELLLAAPQSGFGALFSYHATNFAETPAQDNATGVAALGERAELPAQTITLAAALVSARETGFALTGTAPATPIGVTVETARLADAYGPGGLTVTPDVSVTNFRIGGAGGQDRTDLHGAVTVSFNDHGPGQAILKVQSVQSNDADGRMSARTDAVLAGIGDTAPGIWSLRLLAGWSRRAPAFGEAIAAPVLEEEFDWSPGDLDEIRIDAAREIDDPDQISAAPYTLSAIKLSLVHAGLRNVIFNLSAQAENAAYLQTNLNETLFDTDAVVTWRIDPALALKAAYAFHDRQANFLRAANEHVLTFGVTWTP